MITIHPHEARLQQAKTAQRDPDWQQTYRSTRPTVERKIAHFTRRAWGGRRARCRGRARILTDVITRAGAINLARLAVLGLHHPGRLGNRLTSGARRAYTGRPGPRRGD